MSLPDERDPMRAAFDDYQRAPRDVVPPREKGADDLAALADTTQTITHYEMTADGITQHTEHLEITRPIMGGRNENQ